MNHRTLVLTAALAAVAARPSNAAPTPALVGPSLVPALVGATQDGAYFRTSKATVVRNFPDQNGSIFAEVPSGTLVRGYSTSQGKPPYREVEVAGGIPVWVYGQFLQTTDVDGVLLITGSRVNMRPSPELGSNSMPLRSKLDAGQRVRLLERANVSTNFSEDWVRIQAPSTVRAWIVADAVDPIAASEGQAAWAAANPPLPTRSARPSSAATSAASASAAGTPKPASASTAAEPVVAAAVLDALAAADRQFEAASALRSPTSEDWRDVVVAYEAVVEEAPAGTITRQNAASRLERARMQMEIAGVREELDMKARQHDEEVEKISHYLSQRNQRETAHWGRFQERGWVDARPVAGEDRWFLIFGGRTVAEIQCSNERYDLSVFTGFEIGVLGTEMRPAVRATASSIARPRVVDVQRIEVISGSSIRR